MTVPRSALGRQLGWFVMLGVLVSLGLFGGYHNLRTAVEASLEETVSQRIAVVGRELDLTRDIYLERVHAAMRVLRHRSLDRDVFDRGIPARGETVAVGTRTVRDVRFGSTPTAMRFDLVDETVALVGGTATIFTRDGDDFVRISTNVRTPEGGRAVATVLDPKGPAIAAVRRGEAYYGAVDILGRAYISGYEPIRAADGDIIGIYYVGYPVESLAAIGRQISDTRLLGRGFLALVAPSGHPLFRTAGADSALIARAAGRAAAGLEATWTDGDWEWRAERFPQWRFTLLAAVHRPDVKEESWARALAVFGFMTPLIAGVLALGFIFARRLTGALAQAERLREEARKLALVASRTYNGVLITGPTGKIEWVNDAFTRLTGYTPAEVVGRHPDSFLMGPDTSPATLAEKKKAREELRGFQLEILNYHKSGRPLWILADGQPVLDEQGRVVHYIVVQVDISKRRKVEDDLRLAREAAEEASRTKSAFLANMSHELRTPMNAIIGYSEMLAEDAEDRGRDDFIPDLKKIHAAGKHLLGLINDVLDLSKIEAGKMTLYLEDFAVPAMIAEVTATIQPLVEKNTNRLAVVCPPGLGTMRADVTKVRQTLFNLLSNAAKFTHGGSLELSVAPLARDGVPCFAFRVADTGIGMTPAQLGKLFQAFVQADASTTRKYGGTGLGLAISRKFCQLMGGDITVSSEVGQGTVFTAILPVRVPDPAVTQAPFSPGAPALASAAPVSASQSPSGGAPATGAPVHAGAPLVLVVDDDPAVVDLLGRNLAREGYRVRSAPNGRDALALARELRPHLVTLDVMMPSMDGWSVLTALKADPVTRTIPVVMISLVEDKQLGFALGAADYLTKPIDRAQLSEILAKHVARDRERLALVIDDLPDNRAMLRHTLESEEWTVLEAENGRAGLALFADHRPTLVLLDLMMPVMDGFEFLRELRAREDGRAVPVVVVTAKELTPAEREVLRACVENIVQKGAVSHEGLLAEIRGKIAAASSPHT